MWDGRTDICWNSIVYGGNLLLKFLTQPERIQGHAYNIRSDLWSLGVTLMEVAQMRFPFPPEGHPALSPIDLVQYLLDTNIADLLQDDPDPDVPKWSSAFRNYLGYWLTLRKSG
jgi:serine/threonine protein kinase